MGSFFQQVQPDNSAFQLGQFLQQEEMNRLKEKEELNKLMRTGNPAMQKYAEERLIKKYGLAPRGAALNTVSGSKIDYSGTSESDADTGAKKKGEAGYTEQQWYAKKGSDNFNENLKRRGITFDDKTQRYYKGKVVQDDNVVSDLMLNQGAGQIAADKARGLGKDEAVFESQQANLESGDEGPAAGIADRNNAAPVQSFDEQVGHSAGVAQDQAMAKSIAESARQKMIQGLDASKIFELSMNESTDLQVNYGKAREFIENNYSGEQKNKFLHQVSNMYKNANTVQMEGVDKGSAEYPENKNSGGGHSRKPGSDSMNMLHAKGSLSIKMHGHENLPTFAYESPELFIHELKISPIGDDTKDAIAQGEAEIALAKKEKRRPMLNKIPFFKTILSMNTGTAQGQSDISKYDSDPAGDALTDRYAKVLMSQNKMDAKTATKLASEQVRKGAVSAADVDELYRKLKAAPGTRQGNAGYPGYTTGDKF